MGKGGEIHGHNLKTAHGQRNKQKQTLTNNNNNNNYEKVYKRPRA